MRHGGGVTCVCVVMDDDGKEEAEECTLWWQHRQ